MRLLLVNQPGGNGRVLETFPLFVLGGNITFGPVQIEEFPVLAILIVQLEKSLRNLFDQTFVETSAYRPYVIYVRRCSPEDHDLFRVHLLLLTSLSHTRKFRAPASTLPASTHAAVAS